MSGEYCKSGCNVGQCKLIGLIAVETLAGELISERPTDDTSEEQLDTFLNGHAALLDLCTSYAGTNSLHLAEEDDLPPAA